MSESHEVNPLNVDDATLERLGQELLDQAAPMSKRMRAVFTLRNVGGERAVRVMKDALLDPSALLSHEVAYCLGQMQCEAAIPYLTDALKNETLCSMVRHEAAEALGAIGNLESLPVLEEYKKHPTPEISETCEVAIDLIKFNQEAKAKLNAATGGYLSVDPAPPMETDDVVVVENGEQKKKKKKLTVPELKERLRDRNLSIFQRYRALFALRNIGNGEAVEAIASAFDDPSALFRHELAYVMGQIQSSVAVPALIKVLNDDSQHDMVRHEAAEALGSIADNESLPLLQKFKDDNVQVVKESCQVALDLHEFYNSDSFQYADGLQASH